MDMDNNNCIGVLSQVDRELMAGLLYQFSWWRVAGDLQGQGIRQQCRKSGATRQQIFRFVNNVWASAGC